MITVKNIVKEYAAHRALDGVSFEIKKGSIFGLLGPNGAGKTSLIRIINQITAPDEGQILIHEEPLSAKHIRTIGYLPEERGLYKKMYIGEQMLYLAQLKGLSKKEAAFRIRYWFEKMNMEDWWMKKVEDLSKGMQQKVQFVATVVHEPELIILDEPFSGFDPVNTEIIKKEILELNRNGATIIFSTHRMESVEQLCSSIILLNKAKKILDGEVSTIKNSYRDNSFQITYTSEHEFPVPPNLELYQRNSVQTTGNQHTETIKISPNFFINDVLTYLIPQVKIVEVKEVIPTLNDIFIQQVQQSKSSLYYHE